MRYDISALEDYRRHHGLREGDITDSMIAKFEIDENGEFVHDNREVRSYESRHPKGTRHIPTLSNAVYIVQSSKKHDYNGACEYEPYGIFFTMKQAREFIRNMGWLDEDVDIIICSKGEFRKSIWGWDVDGSDKIRFQ